MHLFESLVRDVRLSLRTLAKAPGFTATAVLSLALAIGASTSVFSLVDAVLLRSLPVPDPGSLRVLHWSGTGVQVPSFDGSATEQDQGRWVDAEAVSYPVFLGLRAQGASEAEVFGFFPLGAAALATGSESLVADGEMVSDNFFPGLQVRPAIGRLLREGEDYSGAAMSVVISHDLWRRAYGLDPAVLGRPVAIDGTAFTIVGVLAPGFSGIQPGRTADFYVPLSAASPFLYAPITSTWHWYVRPMARLRPGGSDVRLGAALSVALGRDAGSMIRDPKVLVRPGRAGLAYDRNAYRTPLLLMLAIVGLVLVASSANLAGLLLARGTARRHELAVRSALGASRWRLFQQSVADSLVLALGGGGLGVLLATWGRAVLSDLLAGRPDGLRYDLSLDSAVLAFSVGVSLAAAVLAGLVPSLQATAVEPIGALRSRGQTAVVRLRTGRILVAAQVCLSLLVLTGAGLFVRTVVNLTRARAGFDMEQLLLVGLNIRSGVNAHADPAQFYDRAQAAVAALPGVESATIVEFPLLSSGGHSGTLAGFLGRAGSSPAAMAVRRLRVGETFFDTMGIPIVTGRGLRSSDAGDAPKVVVVNERFARSYLDGGDPVGLSFKMWEADWQIVGVCGDAKYASIKESVAPTAYFPYRQMFYSRFRHTHLQGAFIAARTALPPLSMSAAVRKAVAGVDPGVAVTVVTTQEKVRDRGIARERMVAALCGGLAVLAVLLCWIGLFGLTAYGVARRTGEIGLRMALGATRLDVTRPILRESLVLTGAGVAAGLPLCIGFTRLVTTQLFGVAPGDPLAIGAAAAILVATAAVSAWIPARRAQRIEPIDALRLDA